MLGEQLHPITGMTLRVKFLCVWLCDVGCPLCAVGKAVVTGKIKICLLIHSHNRDNQPIRCNTYPFAKATFIVPTLYRSTLSANSNLPIARGEDMMQQPAHS